MVECMLLKKSFTHNLSLKTCLRQNHSVLSMRRILSVIKHFNFYNYSTKLLNAIKNNIKDLKIYLLNYSFIGIILFVKKIINYYKSKKYVSSKLNNTELGI